MPFFITENIIMKILFWNTRNNTEINTYIASIIQDYDIDISVLAEYKADNQELLQQIRKKQRRMEFYTTIGCDRITILGNYRNVEPATQNKYYSIQIIDKKYILCGLHLPSDLHGDNENERKSIIRLIINDVQAEENKMLGQNTIIVGDFNEMPYAEGCLGADTFHGLPVYEDMTGRTRTVVGNEYKKYYNPMWNFFGDFTYPPGTYYYNNTKLYAPMWYILDQFIVGQDIIPLLDKKQLKIITECSSGSLSDKNGRPNKNISDHFPIMCGIDEHKGL